VALRVPGTEGAPTDVAIIVVCHNHGRLLAEAIYRVLVQARRPVEILVVDHASSDDTAGNVTWAIRCGKSSENPFTSTRRPIITRIFCITDVKNESGFKQRRAPAVFPQRAFDSQAERGFERIRNSVLSKLVIALPTTCSPKQYFGQPSPQPTSAHG